MQPGDVFVVWKLDRLSRSLRDLLFTLKAITAAAAEFRSVTEAIDLQRTLNASGKSDVPIDAPMPFRKEWRRLVVGADGRINRRLY